jgi:hypothetical protein
MGGKKKGGGKKKAAKAAVDEEDRTVINFMRNYRKKAGELGVDLIRSLKEQYELVEAQEQDVISKFHFWEELGW